MADPSIVSAGAGPAGCRFYVGAHMPNWLATAGVPLFVSAIRLRLRCKRKVPVAVERWALDSGGFTELKENGWWTVPATQYASEVRGWRDRIGRMDWCAIQDWMCEPLVIHGGTVRGQTWKGTRLSVAEHQRRTVHSWHLLRQLAPDLPWVPVVQGYRLDEYLRCVELYAESGTDLRACPLVGVGSVCKRQHMAEAEQIIRALAGLGLKLHGFGFKVQGIARCKDVLASADSMAWSYGGRGRSSEARKDRRRAMRVPSLFGCDPAPVGRSPANDLSAALAFYRRVVAEIG